MLKIVNCWEMWSCILRFGITCLLFAILHTELPVASLPYPVRLTGIELFHHESGQKKRKKMLFFISSIRKQILKHIIY